LIDSTLTAAGTTPKSGYTFAVEGTNNDAAGHPQGFGVSAFAQTWNRTGLRSFCAIEDNVVHVKVETQQGAAITATNCTGLPALNN
jgi:hypothetical protein